MKKRLFHHLLVAALAFASLGGCRKKNDAATGAATIDPVPVQIGEVRKKDMPVELRAIGNVEAIATVEIKAQVGGELLEVNFEEGQDVKKGDLLFTIQPKLYATQLAQAEANLARDRAVAENARRDSERNSQLSNKGAVSREQLDQMGSVATSAEATVKADEALVEIARVRLGYTTVESPINGRTGALQVQAGNLIKENADEPMVIVNQLAPIYVTFSIPEQYLSEIRRGALEGKLPVTALDPKTGKPLADGTLTFINNSVDSTTGTVMLKATFSNESRVLWPGGFVDVLLRLTVETNATVAPASAIVNGQRGQQVYVVKEDGSAELRPVTVARTVGQEAVIQKGVEPGEMVVTNGQLRLFPGAKVVARPEGTPPPAKAAGGTSNRLEGTARSRPS
jgi:membrane fusion protein, multidrug efflux system